MAAQFSKEKMAEVQEKKVMAGLKEGLLSRKCQRDNEPSKREYLVVTFSTVLLSLRCPPSSTSSLEMITQVDGVPTSKGRGKAVAGILWDDATCVVARARDVVSIKDIKPLMTKTSNELMSSHVQKIMQVLGESLYILEKYSDYEKKIVMAHSKANSLLYENEVLKTKGKSLSNEMEKAQVHLKTLEREVNNKKAFSKMNDK